MRSWLLQHFSAGSTNNYFTLLWYTVGLLNSKSETKHRGGDND